MNRADRRITRQRTALVRLLDEIEGFRSARHLHELLGERGEDVGLTTVYRTLQTLVTAGQADMLRLDHGEAVYRRRSSRRHHHLVCRSCGHAVEVAGPAVAAWVRRIAGEHGFSDIAYTVEIFGVCGRCAR
ncbi:Fur family transcriptional regulator [Amycolatopsis sp. EV170708-02-1]|uniref:Fur family transcriptional regulator n=1 Tax=Amycolatopsis sp. EV170708-02-1 TaxID=2919322 RepID=UPI001F0B7224|nr:Fur family transcriptional regulator [Amycolatopsis sp. EV170708-02-1]UMP03393.1 transcriptional repressor [Amycolatopsis sp. EV170708-02-1]